MAKDIWSSNEPIAKHRPAASLSSAAPSRKGSPWDDDKPSGGQTRWLWAIGAVVLVGLAWFFLAKPAIVGYQTYTAMKGSGVPETYLQDMQGFQQAKTVAEAQAAQAAQDAAAAQAASQQCALQRDEENTRAQQQVQSCQSDAQSKASALDSCESALNLQEPALKDAARRICCVQRVDNPSINAYEITDGRITCVTEGGDAIDC